MDIVVGVIVGVIVLTILVVIHELGHALVARRHGVVVEEFGVGFPPRAWGRKVKNSILGKNVLLSINWLPLGGFVKLQGEHDAADGPGDYGAVSFWKKTQILLAGVVMNWLTAALLFTILAVTGMPKFVDNQFTVPSDTKVARQPVQLASVSKGMPAELAGLRRGDTIVRFDNQAVSTAQALADLAANSRGKEVKVAYVRDGQELQSTVKIRSNNDDKKGFFGASPSQSELMRSTWSAPIVGVGTTVQLTGMTIEGLGKVVGDAFSGLYMKVTGDQAADKKLAAVGDSVAGPVGIFGVIFPAAEKAGPVYVVMLAAIISLTLAVMNILPIPALDGGRWFVTAIFRLLKKPLEKQREEAIHGTGSLVLILLIILVTIADFGKLG